MFGNRIAHTQSTGGKRLGLIYVSGDGNVRKRTGFVLGLSEFQTMIDPSRIVIEKNGKCTIPCAYTTPFDDTVSSQYGRQVSVYSFTGDYAIILAVPFMNSDYIEINGVRLMLKDLFENAVMSDKMWVETVDAKLVYYLPTSQYHDSPQGIRHDVNIKMHLVLCKKSDLYKVYTGLDEYSYAPSDIVLSNRFTLYDGDDNDVDVKVFCTYLSSAGLDDWLDSDGTTYDAPMLLGEIHSQAKVSTKDNYISQHILNYLDIKTSGFDFKTRDIISALQDYRRSPFIYFNTYSLTNLHDSLTLYDIYSFNSNFYSIHGWTENDLGVTNDKKLVCNTQYSPDTNNSTLSIRLQKTYSDASDPSYPVEDYLISLPFKNILAGGLYVPQDYGFNIYWGTEIYNSESVSDGFLMQRGGYGSNIRVQAYETQSESIMRFTNPLYTP